MISVKEMGAALILPLPRRQFTGVTIMVLPLVLHYVPEMKLYSSYFKFEQVQSDFGHIVVEALSSGCSNYANMCGQDLHWGIIHDQFMQMINDNDTDAVEPQLQGEDLESQSVEETLYRLKPVMPLLVSITAAWAHQSEER